ncbi:MAG TPA: DUF3333 domain-containing protein, partial [Hyphomonadaceae bacterium]|nr:DUF3333 domain-containing protein [Hyphomonadaceae bacterium]
MSSGHGIASNPAALKRLRRRYREEGRFRAYGIAAIVFAVLSLAVLMISIIGESVSAFTKHEMAVQLTIDPAIVDPTGERNPEHVRANVSGFSDLFRRKLKQRFPEAAGEQDLRRQLNRLVSTLAGSDLARRVSQNPQLIGQTIQAVAPVSDVIDLYLKGLITDERIVKGSAQASVSRAGKEVTIRSAGGFAEVYEDMADRLRAEAKTRQDAADVSQASIDRVNGNIEQLDARRADLSNAGAASVVSAAEAYVSDGKPGDVELARIAGAAAGGGDVTRFRTALAKRLSDEAAAARKEAGELLARGGSYAQKAEAAAANGEPTAETRRIQAETAYLAADRRRVDAALLDDHANAVASLDAPQLTAMASLVVGRALTPAAALVGADVSGAKGAVIKANAVEILAAEAAVSDQQARISRLQAEAQSLKTTSAKRAEALEKTALPAAKSRLARLERERDTRRETGSRLSGAFVPAAPAQPTEPATVTPSATPAQPQAPGEPQLTPFSLADDAAFVTTEREAQLGLDLGGPLAVAYELGALDAKLAGADAGLKGLMVAHADLEISKARADVERLSRKRDRDAQIASGVLARIAQAGAPITPDEFSPSLLVEINGGVVKALRVERDSVVGEELMPLKSEAAAEAGAWKTRELEVAEADRLVTDRQAAWANALKASGDIKSVINFDLLTRSDSTYPELAGLAAALAGSFWI